MCMLTFLHEGVQPDPQALRNATYTNNDGHGFAIVDQGGLIVRHGTDPEDVIANFLRLRAKHPSGPAMFHSRFGTSGAIGRFNCHPFRIGGDQSTVLAHNGVLPRMVQPASGDRRCDTRITAEDLLRGEDLGNPKIRAGIANWVGPGNKLVILSTNPRYGEQYYIINEHSGIWEGDTWYSNTDYQDVDNAHWAQYYADEQTCWSCEQPDEIDVRLARCRNCGICLDCGENWREHCQCYLPEAEEATGGWAELIA